MDLVLTPSSLSSLYVSVSTIFRPLDYDLSEKMKVISKYLALMQVGGLLLEGCLFRWRKKDLKAAN